MIMERCIHGIKNLTNCVYCGTMPLKHEIQTLRAKVASAELLVDALKNSIEFISGSVHIESNSFDDPPSPVSEWDYQADMLVFELNEALESYKKLSEVKHDTK